MPSSLSTAQFLAILEQSNLLAADRMAKLRRRIQESAEPPDVERMARSLVEGAYLTPWQARQLLAGRHSFFIGRYKLLDRIGKGGMGVVFKAQHAVMDRLVAIKLMAHSLLANPRAVARFNREVKTAAALHHPNIIAAYDADSAGNTHFLVMEYAQGRDLNDWLRTMGPLPVAAACEFAMQAAEGLAHAHRQKMVHRDIKPVNLLVTWNVETNRPLVKILDMGLARFVSEVQEEGGVTQLGQAVGTPDYIAPEAAQNFMVADIRADIFSLGCSLYKLLSGQLPFGGNNTMEKLLARMTADAAPLRGARKDIPEVLEAVIAKMLARDPAKRYQTPAELAVALSPFAASTIGDRATLESFRPPSGERSAAVGEIQADPDSSLEEFLRDFASAPDPERTPPSIKAPRPAPAPPQSDDEELELAPLPEDSPTTLWPEEVARSGSAVVSSPAAASPTASGPTASPQHATPRPKSAGKEPQSRGGEAGPQPPPYDDIVADRIDLTPEGFAAPAKQSWFERRPISAASHTTWDSPLLLVGGGVLLALVILGGALFWALTRQTGDEVLRLAEADYRAGSYNQAIAEYDRFLYDHPRHAGASLARVRRGMARLWRDVEAQRNGSTALATAHQVLAEIDKEDAFGEVKAELADVLPRIAAGLAAAAHEKKSSALVKQAHDALSLVAKHVDAPLRPASKLADINQSLDQTTQQLARGTALAKAIDQIGKAVAQGDSNSAYTLRARLLRNDPNLASEPSLEKAIVEAARSEQGRVRFVAQPIAAITSEHEGPIRATLAFVQRTHGTAPSTDGRVVLALAGGAAYALEATSGRVLWRRFVGFDTSFVPVALAETLDADAVLVDAARHEVIRVDAHTGALRWRCPIGEPFEADPVLAGPKLYLATRGGRLVSIDVESGNSAGHTALPQPLRVAPAVDSALRHLYQLGEHSNLYVLAAETGECEEVAYLGFSAASVRTPPVLVGRFVVVAENRALDDGVLRILRTDEAGLSLAQVQELPLAGHVYAPPQVVAGRLYVATDRGGLYSFAVGAEDQPTPLVIVAERAATDEERLIRFGLVRRERWWVASRGLTHYAVQAAGGRLDPRRIDNEDDVFLQPPAAIGDAIFHVRQRTAGGIAVSAISEDSASRLWETILAIPVAGRPVVSEDGREIRLVNIQGALYRADASTQPASAVVDAPLAEINPPEALSPHSTAARLSDGRLCVVNDPPGSRVLLVEPGQSRNLQWLRLPVELACAPLELGSGLLALGKEGIVALVDARTSKNRCEPFQPRVEPGSTWSWNAVAVERGKEAVACDGRSRLYRLGIRGEPAPHLSALVDVELSEPLSSRLTAIGRTVVGVDAKNRLTAFELPELRQTMQADLGAKCVWGPQTVGDLVLVATEDAQLAGYDAMLRQVWKVPLPQGIPVGDLLVDSGSLVFASRRGIVWRVAAEDGQTRGSVETGQPLVSEPIRVGDRLVVCSADGCLHWIDPP